MTLMTFACSPSCVRPERPTKAPASIVVIELQQSIRRVTPPMSAKTPAGRDEKLRSLPCRYRTPLFSGQDPFLTRAPVLFLSNRQLPQVHGKTVLKSYPDSPPHWLIATTVGSVRSRKDKQAAGLGNDSRPKCMTGITARLTRLKRNARIEEDRSRGKKSPFIQNTTPMTRATRSRREPVTFRVHVKDNAKIQVRKRLHHKARRKARQKTRQKTSQKTRRAWQNTTAHAKSSAKIPEVRVEMGEHSRCNVSARHSLCVMMLVHFLLK